MNLQRTRTNVLNNITRLFLAQLKITAKYSGPILVFALLHHFRSRFCKANIKFCAFVVVTVTQIYDGLDKMQVSLASMNGFRTLFSHCCPSSTSSAVRPNEI